MAKAAGFSLRTHDDGRRRLESFLFGSDLQWQVNGYTDQVHTPLSRLLPRLVPGPTPHPLAERRWNSAQLRTSPNAPPVPALVAAPGGDDDRLLLSYVALPEGVAMLLDVFRRTRTPQQVVRLQRHASNGRADSPIRVYRVAPAPAAALPVAGVAPTVDGEVEVATAARAAIAHARRDRGAPSTFDVHPSTL
jgi:hypothetical protein